MTGDAPDGDRVDLSLTCDPVLPEAERETARHPARRFVDEPADGWGCPRNGKR